MPGIREPGALQRGSAESGTRGPRSRTARLEQPSRGARGGSQLRRRHSPLMVPLPGPVPPPRAATAATAAAELQTGRETARPAPPRKLRAAAAAPPPDAERRCGRPGGPGAAVPGVQRSRGVLACGPTCGRAPGASGGGRPNRTPPRRAGSHSRRRP